VKVSKVVVNPQTRLFEEPFDAELDARLIPERFLWSAPPCLPAAADLVRVGILFYQRTIAASETSLITLTMSPTHRYLPRARI